MTEHRQTKSTPSLNVNMAKHAAKVTHTQWTDVIVTKANFSLKLAAHLRQEYEENVLIFKLTMKLITSRLSSNITTLRGLNDMLTALLTYLRNISLWRAFKCRLGLVVIFPPTLWPHLSPSSFTIYSVLLSAGLYLKYTHMSSLRLRPPSLCFETAALVGHCLWWVTTVWCVEHVCYVPGDGRDQTRIECSNRYFLGFKWHAQ